MTRRLAGRSAPATLGVLVAAGVLAGCASPTPTALSYCATTAPPGVDPVIVDDANCAQPSAQYQVLEQDVPDDDGGGGGGIFILGLGDRVDHRDRRYRPLPRGAQVRAGSAPAATARAQLGTGSRGGTITRGGLGVASSAGGAKGGGSSSSGS